MICTLSYHEKISMETGEFFPSNIVEIEETYEEADYKIGMKIIKYEDDFTYYGTIIDIN